MTTFRLYKFGQNAPVHEFRGNSLLHNGHSLLITNLANEIIASLSLEPGYYLVDSTALVASMEQHDPMLPVNNVRSLRP